MNTCGMRQVLLVPQPREAIPSLRVALRTLRYEPLASTFSTAIERAASSASSVVSNTLPETWT